MPGKELVLDKRYSVILLLLPAVAALKHGCTLFDTPPLRGTESVSSSLESWGACDRFDQQRTKGCYVTSEAASVIKGDAASALLAATRALGALSRSPSYSR